MRVALVGRMLGRISAGLFFVAIAISMQTAPVSAQAACPPRTEDGVNSLLPSVSTQLNGTCAIGFADGGVYDNMPFQNNQPMIIVFPDSAPRPASGPNDVKIQAESSIGVFVNITTVICDGGTVTNVGTTVASVRLPDGGSCALFAAAPSGRAVPGTLVSYQTTLSRSGDVYSATAGTMTGDIYGGTVQFPTNGQSSQELGSQQAALSTLVVNFQSNNLGDAVFEQLDDVFGGGDGPVITLTGFSASTRGVANWIGRKRQEQLESRLADLPAREDGTKVTVTPVANLLPMPQPDWNAWIRGKYAFYDGDGSSFDGHSIDVLAGFDYRVREGMVIGLVAGYGNADFDALTGGTSGAFTADGYTAGPYMGVKLGDNAQFDALAAYTYSDYDNRTGTVSGDFTAHRVTVGARLKGTWRHEGYFVEPGIRVLYAEEWQEAYTDSAGVRQSSLTVKAGRVSVGPKIGYSHRTDDGLSVKTWVAARGEYDFSNQNGAPTSGLPDLDDILSARLSAGIEATTADGLNVAVEGDIGGLGSGEYTSCGGSARVGMPF